MGLEFLKKNKRRKNTIFSKIFVPIMLTVCIQLFFFVVLLQGNLLSFMKDNSIESLREKVSNRGVTIQNEMLGKWSNINSSVDTIVNKIETVLVNHGATTQDMKQNAALNQTIIGEMIPEIIHMLRSSSATEVFLVLDGSGVEADSLNEVKAGIYLRNSNPNVYSDSNDNLLFERGIPSISKQWKIPLDSFWSAGFDLSDQDNPNNQFFYKPLNAAKNNDNKNSENYAYWGYSHILSEVDTGIITYSLPLITSGGQVIGVIGIGIEEHYFNQNLFYQELDHNNNAIYLIAKTTDNKNLETIVLNGSPFNRGRFGNTTLELNTVEEENINKISIKNKAMDQTMYASVRQFSLYNNNTPFQNEKWLLVGMIDSDNLFSDYNEARFILYLVSLASILIGIVAVVFTSRRITLPISRLADDLRKSNPNKPIILQKLNVAEIDELTVSIEFLSAEVAESASKISKIISMTEASIGVFEYRKSEDTVFCSKGLYEIFEWEPILDSNEYIDSSLFKERMKLLEPLVVDSDVNIIQFKGRNGETKWLKMNSVDEKKSVIGIVSDVTQSVLEKKQIEYERDYDILTNVYNRRAFIDAMNRLFNNKEDLHLGAFIVWDLDNLKFVNDSYGHSTGDQYIIALAECLKSFDGKNILSARRSGDEFYTFIFGYSEKQDILDIIHEMWSKIQRKEIELPNRRAYRIRVSAGVAWYPQDSTDYDELFRYADFAMYTVKHNRKGDIEEFNPQVYSENKILLQGQEEFNNLLDNHLIKFALQPIVSVKDSQVYGYELLMRSDVEMFPSPADILRVAHAQSRLYEIEVMTWVEGMKTFAGLSECGAIPAGTKVFINSISNQKINRDCEKLLETIYGKYLSQVICEFTEEEDGNEALFTEKINMLHGWGAGLAIDDYGRGYNNQSILLGTTPDVLKIDIEIVRGIHNDEDRQALAYSIISYCHERNILVVAEGVETPQEMKTLILLGADLLQGYYIGKPSFEASLPKKKIQKEISSYYEEYIAYN